MLLILVMQVVLENLPLFSNLTQFYPFDSVIKVYITLIQSLVTG